MNQPRTADELIATLSEFGAQSQVVLAVAKSVTREFGVLITGILVAGRSGSAFAARIGSMSVSQEVDALGVMGIDPVRYLVAPALIAMLLMLPILTILSDFAAGFLATGFFFLAAAGATARAAARSSERDAASITGGPL